MKNIKEGIDYIDHVIGEIKRNIINIQNEYGWDDSSYEQKDIKDLWDEYEIMFDSINNISPFNNLKLEETEDFETNLAKISKIYNKLFKAESEDAEEVKKILQDTNQHLVAILLKIKNRKNRENKKMKNNRKKSLWDKAREYFSQSELKEMKLTLKESIESGLYKDALEIIKDLENIINEDIQSEEQMLDDFFVDEFEDLDYQYVDWDGQTAIIHLSKNKLRYSKQELIDEFGLNLNDDDLEMYENISTIEELLEFEGIDFELDPEYSGRGMFGKTTTGYIVDSYGFNTATDLLRKLNIPFRTDNMGLNYIIY